MNTIRLERVISAHPVDGWDAKGRHIIHCSSRDSAIQYDSEYIRIRSGQKLKAKFYRVIDRHKFTRIDPRVIEFVTFEEFPA